MKWKGSGRKKRGGSPHRTVSRLAKHPETTARPLRFHLVSAAEDARVRQGTSLRLCRVSKHCVTWSRAKSSMNDKARFVDHAREALLRCRAYVSPTSGRSRRGGPKSRASFRNTQCSPRRHRTRVRRTPTGRRIREGWLSRSGHRYRRAPCRPAETGTFLHSRCPFVRGA